MLTLPFIRCSTDDHGPFLVGLIVREASEGDEGEAVIWEKGHEEKQATQYTMTAREGLLVHSRYVQLQADMTRINAERSEDESVIDEACNRDVFAGIQVRSVSEQVTA